MSGLGAIEEGAAAGERHDPVRHAVHRVFAMQFYHILMHNLL